MRYIYKSLLSIWLTFALISCPFPYIKRHLRYLKNHHPIIYTNLLTSCKLTAYLTDIDEQAEDMFFRLVKQLAEKEGVTEQLKANNQMLWVCKMNNIRNQATEIVNNEIVYNI